MNEQKAIYYGTARPLKKNERRPTMIESVVNGRVSYFGLYTVDERILKVDKKKIKGPSRDDITKKLVGTRGKITRTKRELSDKNISPSQKKAKLLELEKLQAELTKISIQFQEFERKNKTTDPVQIMTKYSAILRNVETPTRDNISDLEYQLIMSRNKELNIQKEYNKLIK